MEFQTTTIERLCSLFAQGPDPIFLLGAGASVRSGIPLADAMVEKIVKWRYRIDKWGIGSGNVSFLEGPHIPRSDWLPWLKGQEWYKTDLNSVDNYPYVVENMLRPQETRKEFFLEITSPQVPPSLGYERMAELMARKRVRTILTTNFDTILPDFCKINRRPHYVNVIQTEDDYTKCSTSPQHPQIIYLHGSVEHYTDKNTSTEINEELDTSLVSMLLPLLKDHPLIVIGYRGAEPSVMKHLLIDYANTLGSYRHGIYWCFRNYKAEGPNNLTSHVRELTNKIGRNFHIVPIDGFDEVMNQLWEQVHHLPDSVQIQTTVDIEKSTVNSYDLQPIKESNIDDFEWPILKSRFLQYCKKLAIPVPPSVNDTWIIDELCNQHLVLRVEDEIEVEKVCPTRGGYLLFAIKPQNYIQSSQVIVRVKGNPKWIERVFGNPENDDGIQDDQIEQIIEGNLWNQLDAIYDILTLVNQPFLLKGEVSTTVQPYPPTALREMIVNALVHRDYAHPEPTIIEITQTDISVLNPGGLVPDVVKKVKSTPDEDLEIAFENKIKSGARGITDCRNRVVADLFYGLEMMEKKGSGLSDIWRSAKENKNEVSFGPTNDNTTFEITIHRRPEDVDEVTKTAYHRNFIRYASNLLEVVKLPDVIWHAGTKVKGSRELFAKIKKEWVPPFVLHAGRLFTFHNLAISDNPFYSQINTNDIEKTSVEEFIKDYGEPRLVWLLKECFYRHLEACHLCIDKKRMRAYFPRTDGGSRLIEYQARVRRATRRVVTRKKNRWEHQSFWFRFERFMDTWTLVLLPSYVFTNDGQWNLLKRDLVNKLSTARQSRDYNNTIHNDLVFWAWVLSGGQQSTFSLNLGPIVDQKDTISLDKTHKENDPQILIKANLSTTTVQDVEAEDPLLEPKRLAQLESEFSQAVSPLNEVEDVNSD